MADENKNKKRSVWDRGEKKSLAYQLHPLRLIFRPLGYLMKACDTIDGKTISDKVAKKLKHPDDPDVRMLEHKNQLLSHTLTYSTYPIKDRSSYLYEPYVRYKRTENPDYKRYKGYSLNGTIAGLGLLLTGFASGNLPFAYAGAALTLTSVGYLSGHSWRQWATDKMFEKVPWPEEKVQEKLKEAKEAKAKEAGLYQSLKYWITDQVSTHTLEKGLEKGPWYEDRWREQNKEPKDEGLYIRRTHYTEYWRMDEGLYWKYPYSLWWHVLDKPTFYHRSKFLLTGAGSLALGGIIAGCGALLGLAPLVYIGATTPLYALGHYAGFLLGKKRAEPGYQKVSGLEKKVQEKD